MGSREAARDLLLGAAVTGHNESCVERKRTDVRRTREETRGRRPEALALSLSTARDERTVSETGFMPSRCA